jgi:hypothetical protein
MKLKLIAAILGLTISGSALASGFKGTVTDVTAEGMPFQVSFNLSGSPCGQFIYGSPDPEANKAVYGMLLSAIQDGGSVWVEYSYGCFVTNTFVSKVHGVDLPDLDRRDRGNLLRRKAVESLVKLLLL